MYGIIMVSLFIYFFNSYFPNIFFFYSTAWWPSYTYILFSHIIMLHHKWLDIVPRAAHYGFSRSQPS